MADGNARPYRQIGHRISDRRRELGRRKGRRVLQKDVADAVGVAEGTVTAWEIGKQRPEGENLVKLALILETTEEFILHGAETELTVREGPPGRTVREAGLVRDQPNRRYGEPEQEALDLFQSVENVARYLRGVAPPGENQALKRDILEGIRRVVTATQPLPIWWLQLQQQVENGEI